VQLSLLFCNTVTNLQFQPQGSYDRDAGRLAITPWQDFVLAPLSKSIQVVVVVAELESFKWEENKRANESRRVLEAVAESRALAALKVVLLITHSARFEQHTQASYPDMQRYFCENIKPERRVVVVSHRHEHTLDCVFSLLAEHIRLECDLLQSGLLF